MSSTDAASRSVKDSDEKGDRESSEFSADTSGGETLSEAGNSVGVFEAVLVAEVAGSTGFVSAVGACCFEPPKVHIDHDRDAPVCENTPNAVKLRATKDTRGNEVAVPRRAEVLEFNCCVNRLGR